MAVLTGGQGSYCRDIHVRKCNRAWVKRRDSDPVGKVGTPSAMYALTCSAYVDWVRAEKPENEIVLCYL